MTAHDRTASPRLDAPERDTLKFVRDYKLQLSIFGILVILYAVFLIGNPAVFTQFPIYRSFMTTMPFFGIMAISVTYVITLGEIDLSFPSVVGISSWVFGTVFVATGSFALAVAGGLLVGLLAGMINGIIITRIGVPSIVATIGTMFLWRGLVNLMSQGKGIALVGLRDSALYDVFVGRLFGTIPVQFVWFVAIALAFGLVYRRHRYGSHLLYVGDNQESARMMGINVERVKTIAFMQMGFFAALAGIFLTAEVTYFWPTQGDGMLLTTLAAVFIGGTSVFGGTGTIFGTFIGVIIIGSLEAGIIAIGLTGFWVRFLNGLLITVSVSVYAFMLKRNR
ncbi:ABC transporter permease [Shumkonia mesophila]|uniref:ABC transporter permease n=1 Tax=Shumkonia mesophila TaxID=2838854 RepID=UPI002934DFBD|nr:ABC transporter permease [Shumkonia mesophila]